MTAWKNPGPGSHHYCHCCHDYKYAKRPKPRGNKATDGYTMHCLKCGSVLEYLEATLEPTQTQEDDKQTSRQ